VLIYVDIKIHAESAAGLSEISFIVSDEYNVVSRAWQTAMVLLFLWVLPEIVVIVNTAE
jgi:hypothetical protein